MLLAYKIMIQTSCFNMLWDDKIKITLGHLKQIGTVAYEEVI